MSAPIKFLLKTTESFTQTVEPEAVKLGKRKHDDISSSVSSASERAFRSLPALAVEPISDEDLELNKRRRLLSETISKTKERAKDRLCEGKDIQEPQREPRRFNFVIDRYTEARGEPKMLEITCRKCKAWVLDYQKDGPGNLLRCYVDRIYHPSALREKTFTSQTVQGIPKIRCQDCGTDLATPMIYRRTFPKPEVRPAYRIISDSRIPRVLLEERKV